MFKIPIRNRIWEIEGPQLMGIINITDDSFYKESRHMGIDDVLRKAEQFLNEGAQIVDVGGQSTRPGASIHGAEQEIYQLTPIVESIIQHFPELWVSIDTFHGNVAAATLASGAHIINDISCGQFDASMHQIVSQHKAGYIGMHITGLPTTMHMVEKRESIMDTLVSYFKDKKNQLAEEGICEWVIDPGFGFGKTVEENFSIVKNLQRLKEIKLPILLGVSRKSTIYKTLGITPKEALNGTTVLHTIGLLNGASILRVHDVKQAKEVIQLLSFLQ